MPKTQPNFYLRMMCRVSIKPTFQIVWFLLTLDKSPPPTPSVFHVLLEISFPELFICWVGKSKGWKSPLRPPLRPPSPTGVFQSQKWESSPFSLHSISMFPHFTSSTSFKGRIKARMQQDECFNLDSNCIKWANRNCWQKPYDEEAITCRQLPHCRRWEGSAGSQV